MNNLLSGPAWNMGADEDERSGCAADCSLAMTCVWLWPHKRIPMQSITSHGSIPQLADEAASPGIIEEYGVAEPLMVGMSLVGDWSYRIQL